MKRISILIIVFLSTITSVSYAGCNDFVHRRSDDICRVHWSIHTQSLIPGDLYYSPYAYRFGGTGLVPYWVRYSPYAFGFDHPSGLVNDLAVCTQNIYYYPNCSSYTCTSRAGCNAGYYTNNCSIKVSGMDYNRESYQQKLALRRQTAKQIREISRQREQARLEDSSRFVTNYLNSRHIDFRPQNYLRIDGQTVSVTFLLEGKNVIVKYWNPDEIDLLEDKPEYKKDIYVKYLQQWNDFCADYINKGGKVCQIISADQKDIDSKLVQCRELIDG